MNRWYRVINPFPGKKRMHQLGEGLQFPADSSRLKVLLEGGYVEVVESEFGVIATSKLANVEIADRDYTEDDKAYFTFDEALEIEKKLKSSGWRLPTRHEWVLIVEEFGQINGELDGGALAQNLGLNYRGVDIKTTVLGDESSGYYWSSTTRTTTGVYNLYLSRTGVGSSDYSNLGYRMSIRLVRDLETKK